MTCICHLGRNTGNTIVRNPISATQAAHRRCRSAQEHSLTARGRFSRALYAQAPRRRVAAHLDQKIGQLRRAGMDQGRDPDKHRCMPWDENQWDHGTRSFQQRILSLRLNGQELGQALILRLETC